jgi:hypothetical protein
MILIHSFACALVNASLLLVSLIGSFTTLIPLSSWNIPVEAQGETKVQNSFPPQSPKHKETSQLHAHKMP